jgi:SAM-dependent methyltransferase
VERFVIDSINTGMDARYMFFNVAIDLSQFYADLEYNGVKPDKRYYHELFKRYARLFSDEKEQMVDGTFEITSTGECDFKFLTFSAHINKYRYDKLKSAAKDDVKFYEHLAKMLLRNSIFEESGQQWSIGNNDLYEEIGKRLNINAELFASPLNFTIPNFCSVMYDTDKYFGSIGSFFDITPAKLISHGIKGAIFNPPYSEKIMAPATVKLLDILANMDKKDIKFNVVSFLPNWQDADYIKTLLASKYTVNSFVYPKGRFTLQDKSTGKLFKGTFNLLVIFHSSKPGNIKTGDITEMIGKAESSSGRDDLLIIVRKIVDPKITKDELKGILELPPEELYAELCKRSVYAPDNSKVAAIRASSRVNDLKSLRIPVKPGNYLDIGGGDGIITAAIGKYVGAKHIYSADVPTLFVRTEKRTTTGVEFITIDSCKPKISLPDNHCTLITAFMSLHHVKPRALPYELKEITRLLIPGGYFVIREHDCRNKHERDMIDMEHLLYDHSVKLTEQECIPYKEGYEAWYRRLEDWDSLLSAYGFVPVGQPVFKKGDNPTKYYLRVYQLRK